MFIGGEGHDEASSVVVPPEDRLCLLESAFGDEFIACEHWVAWKRVVGGWWSGKDVDCERACGVEAIAATREVWADGEHIVDVDVGEAVVVGGEIDEKGLRGVEGDVVRERDGVGNHVLDWGV